MVSRSVFAIIDGRYEMFLGYSVVTGDDSRELLSDVLTVMDPRRSAVFSRLQGLGSGGLFVYARDLESDDPVLDRNRKNDYLFNGDPYIHDLSVLDPLVRLTDGTPHTVNLREADDKIFVRLAGGRGIFCNLEQAT